MYPNARAIELRRIGLNGVPEAPITVYYEGEVVGEYFADLLVEDAVIRAFDNARKGSLRWVKR